MERKHIEADVGVVVGRFQVDDLHQGHIELLNWVESQHKKVIVVLGVSAVKVSKNNPLDFHARANMLSKLYQDFIFVPLVDSRDDITWSYKLDFIIDSLTAPLQSVVLYGARDSFINHYKGKYSTQELVGDDDKWSGSGVRNEIRRGVYKDRLFRSGVIWATSNQYPRIIPTVDIACFKDGDCLLVKKPGEDGYRFPGGFAQPDSDSFEADAKRELLEETGIQCRDISYICNMNIDDWRYRGEVDKIRTTFFHAYYVSGTSKGADDVNWAGWKRLGFMTDEMFVEEHRPLFNKLQEKGLSL